MLGLRKKKQAASSKDTDHLGELQSSEAAATRIVHVRPGETAPGAAAAHRRPVDAAGEAVHRRAGACRVCSVDPIIGLRFRALRSGYGRGIVSFCSACMSGPLGPSLRATEGPFKVLHEPLGPEELERELREGEDGHGPERGECH